VALSKSDRLPGCIRSPSVARRRRAHGFPTGRVSLPIEAGLSLWPAMADGVLRMLATGPGALAVKGEGSAVAFSGAPVADLNMAFAWSDARALDALARRNEDFVLVASPEGNAAVRARAAELGIVAVPEPLPVWFGPIDVGALPAPRWNVRHASRRDMAAVRHVLAAAFGLSVEPLETAFPDAIADDVDVHLSERDGTPVSAVMAIRSGKIVSLWSGGTVPGARNGGAFTDLLGQVLRLQSERGATSFAGITEAVASGIVVQRLGGRRASDGHVWLRGSSVGELLQR